jgi:hypothetical protein
VIAFFNAWNPKPGVQLVCAATLDKIFVVLSTYLVDNIEAGRRAL